MNQCQSAAHDCTYPLSGILKLHQSGALDLIEQKWATELDKQHRSAVEHLRLNQVSTIFIVYTAAIVISLTTFLTEALVDKLSKWEKREH